MRQLGIELGGGKLRLALCAGGKVLRLGEIDLPEGLERDPAALALLAGRLKAAAGELGLRCRRAVWVLGEDAALLRRFPASGEGGRRLGRRMRDEFQTLLGNRAAEYQLCRTAPEKTEPGFLGIALRTGELQRVKAVLELAGFTLTGAVPRALLYAGLLRDRTGHACLLNLESGAADLHFYRAGSWLWSRRVEGLSGETVAEEIGRTLAWYAWRTGIYDWSVYPLGGRDAVLEEDLRAALAEAGEGIDLEPAEALLPAAQDDPLAPACAAALAAGLGLWPRMR